MRLSEQIAVFGLGKLGAPLAVWLASQGHRVSGVDSNPAVVEQVNAGQSHLVEPGYPELLTRVKDRFTATTSARLAVQYTDSAIVLVPTPSEEDGRFSNNYVLAACRDIAAALVATPDKKYLVIIASTVMPGSCGGPIRQTLPDNCGLVYSPEFVALGDVIAGFNRPDFVLLGADDDWSRARAAAFYRALYPEPLPLHTMSLVSAEIAKISLNAYITMKMTFANELGRYCAAVIGADVDVILAAIGDDRRIGGQYLRAGAPYSGPCFPRDNRAFAQAAVAVGVGLEMPLLVDRRNRAIVSIVAQKALDNYQGRYIGIVGLSYKPHTPLTDESLGIALCQALQDKSFLVTYDPLVAWPDIPALHSIANLLAAADCVVLTQDRPEWRDLSARPGQVFIDCWRILDGKKIVEQGGVYIPLWRKI